MRTWNRGLWIVPLLSLTLTGIGCSSGSSTPPSPPAVTYTISGTVSGTTAVTVSLSGAATMTATTGADGTYSFTGLANGSYTVAPSKAGFAFSPLATAVTVSGADQANKNFTATAAASTYTVSGAVTGAILDGVTITISQASAALGTVNTSGGGSYSFNGVANGTYVLTAAKAGFSFAPVTLDVAVAGANRPGQDFVATAIPRTISGQVTGASGVTLTLDGTSTAITDGSGNYTLTTIAGTHTVVPSKGGYTFSPVNRSVPVTDADVIGQDFAATPTAGYSITGTVTGPWVKGVTVRLTGSQTTTTTTDLVGAYAFTGLPNGTFTVTPALDGYGYSPAAPSVVMGGANKTQDFTATSTIASYSISGTVTYAGTKTGRVYLSVYSTSCGNCGAMAGTSIAAPGAYTVRGLTPGGYSVVARLDSVGKGSRNANDPTGSSSGPVTITSANANASITLVDPSVTPTPDVPGNVNVLPGDGVMLVIWNSVVDTNNTEKVTSYNICWAANATGVGCTTTANLPANQDGTFFHSGLTNGTDYSYKVRSNVGATNGVWSSVVTAKAGPATGGTTVSGTVTYTGTATGPLLVAVGDPNAGGGMQVTSVPTPSSSPVAFSVAGVQPGTWSVYAIIDQNQNGIIDEGDLKNVNGGDAPMVTVGATPVSGVAVTLSAARGLATTTTENSRSGGPSNYSAQLTLNDGTQRVVKAVLFSGKGLPLPLDVPKDREHFAWFNLGATAPAVGDAFFTDVTYADGSPVETLSPAVTAVLGSFVTGMAEATSGGTNTVNRPTFSWTAPSSPPSGTWGYSLSVRQNAGGSAWDYPKNSWMFPNSTTFVQYNSDGNAYMSSLTTGAYVWSLSVVDAHHNRARLEKTYNVP